MRLLLQFIILTTLSISCGILTDSEESPYSLYRQRIHNSPYVIYEFAFSGSFVTSSDYTGLTILDSNVTFSRDLIEVLPSDLFAAKPSPNHLKMVRVLGTINPTTPNDTMLTPANRYSKIIRGFKVDVLEYEDTYGSPISTGLMEYEFDGAKEIEDSLILFKIKHKFGSRIFPSTTSIVKGNIRIVDTADNEINFIEVSQMIVGKGEVYKPPKPFDLVPNQPIVGTALYRFYPKTATKATNFSDYGIFKRIK